MVVHRFVPVVAPKHISQCFLVPQLEQNILAPPPSQCFGASSGAKYSCASSDIVFWRVYTGDEKYRIWSVFRINLAVQIGDPRFWCPVSSGVASQIGNASKLVFYSLLFLQIEKNDYP
jgi:hypothetical protein